jgi:superfamily II DNA helicase RecQ
VATPAALEVVVPPTTAPLFAPDPAPISTPAPTSSDEAEAETDSDDEPPRSLLLEVAHARRIEIECDETLFDRLRKLRKRLADERGVPAYVILGDNALRQMAREYPLRVSDLQGVGEGAAHHGQQHQHRQHADQQRPHREARIEPEE